MNLRNISFVTLLTVGCLALADNPAKTESLTKPIRIEGSNIPAEISHGAKKAQEKKLAVYLWRLDDGEPRQSVNLPIGQLVDFTLHFQHLFSDNTEPFALCAALIYDQGKKKNAGMIWNISDPTDGSFKTKEKPAEGQMPAMFMFTGENGVLKGKSSIAVFAVPRGSDIKKMSLEKAISNVITLQVDFSAEQANPVPGKLKR